MFVSDKGLRAFTMAWMTTVQCTCQLDEIRTIWIFSFEDMLNGIVQICTEQRFISKEIASK